MTTTIFPTLTTSMPSLTPGSELAHARAHLLSKRYALERARYNRNTDHLVLPRDSPQVLIEATRDFLAALSWVWDAQERAYAAEVKPYFDYVSETLQQSTDDFLDRMARYLVPKHAVARKEMERRRALIGKPKRSRARAKAA